MIGIAMQGYEIYNSNLVGKVMGFLFLLLVVQKNLEAGEVLAVDVACVVAISATVNVQVKYNGPIRRVVFGVSCST